MKVTKDCNKDYAHKQCMNQVGSISRCPEKEHIEIIKYYPSYDFCPFCGKKLIEDR